MRKRVHILNADFYLAPVILPPINELARWSFLPISNWCWEFFGLHSWNIIHEKENSWPLCVKKFLLHHFYRLPKKLRKGNVFSRVCLSVCSQREGVTCDHYQWCIGSQFTDTHHASPHPLSTWDLTVYFLAATVWCIGQSDWFIIERLFRSNFTWLAHGQEQSQNVTWLWPC